MFKMLVLNLKTQWKCHNNQILKKNSCFKLIMLYNFRLFKKDKIFQGISKNQNEVKVIPYLNRTKVLSFRSMRVLIRLIRAA